MRLSGSDRDSSEATRASRQQPADSTSGRIANAIANDNEAFIARA